MTSKETLQTCKHSELVRRAIKLKANSGLHPSNKRVHEWGRAELISYILAAELERDTRNKGKG